MSDRLRIKRPWLARRYWPLWCAAACLLTLAAWVCPRRHEGLITIDGRHSWSAADGESPREIAWQPPSELSRLLPPGAKAQVSHPHLADGGATLYLTVRLAGSDADIYRSRYVNGRWQPAEAMLEWNTPWDEQAVAVAADGREAWFASNRPGGHGGFDLYVCRRGTSDWGLPKNAPAPLNTAGDEHDPALSPDSRLLYFAANRANDGVHTALFSARRTARGKPWSEPEAVLPAEFADANQRSPCIAAGGAFLYFASDRPNGAGPSRNFDLYRLPLADLEARIEGLGPAINTAANETDPSVSADGFAIVFASDRATGRPTNLYRSAAAEVRRVAIWDTSRWQALRAVWSKAFLATLLFVGIAVVVYYSREWLWQTASLGRFLAASLLLHALVIWLTLIVPLSQEIIERVDQIRVSQSAAQLADDNLHQSHEAGKEAYEKVADLQAPAPVAMPDISRQVVQPQNVPIPVDRDLPSLPAEQALRLPAERLIFIPALRPVPAKQREALPRSTSAPRPVALEPLALAPPPRVEPPAPPPLSQSIDLTRNAAALPAAEVAPQPKREPPQVVAASLAPEVPLRELRVKPPSDAVPVERRLRGVKIASVELEPEGLALGNSPAPVEQQSQPAEVRIDRAESSLLAPAERVKVMQSSVPRPSPLTAQDVDQDRPLPQPAKNNDRTVLPRLAARAPPAAEIIEEKPPIAPAVNRAEEKPVAGATTEQAPAMPAPLEINNPLPREARGAQRLREPRLIVGALAGKAVDAPPSTSPWATRLDRPRAKAAPVAYAEDNIGMQAMFSLRQGDARREIIDLVGGNEQSEAAVRRGLQWLAEHQHADGRWSLHQLDPPEKGLPATTGPGSIQSDTAATGLGLLPFLGSGHTHREGEYQAVVAKALGWLVERQKPSGDLFADSPSNAYMYSHGIAAIALCESYGLSQDEKLRDPAQRAIDFIVSAQHAGTGGWRYRPGEPGDMSVVGWQVMALKSSEMAGLNVPPAALDAAGRWLDSAAGRGDALGTFGYQGPGGSPAMTAEGLLCRQFLGSRRSDPQLKAGAEYLLKHLPQPGSETSYYWYYATQVMYHMQGNYWTAWNERLRGLLVESQIKEGPASGAWDPRDAWEQQGGRLYATSLRLLILEVYYRHLPLYGPLE
jgi:hypothetical protein